MSILSAFLFLGKQISFLFFATISEAELVSAGEFVQNAIAWIKRSPFQNGEVELRPIFESEDFGEAFIPRCC
jgi:hypothetical protein